MDNNEFNTDFNEYLGIISKKCNRCFKIKNLNEYKYRKCVNEYYKCCIKCIDYNIKSHDKRKCIHNRQKFKCKLCSKDAINLTFKNMVYNSKTKDIMICKYDKDNFIDKMYLCYLYTLQNNKCYYCDIELQYIYYGDDLSSIERIDNNYGHIKSNCVLSCLLCNRKRLNNKITILDTNVLN